MDPHIRRRRSVDSSFLALAMAFPGRVGGWGPGHGWGPRNAPFRGDRVRIRSLLLHLLLRRRSVDLCSLIWLLRALQGLFIMDRRSEVSRATRVEVPVLIHCSGDFCDYDEAFEIADMKSDPDFNTKAELRKARNKYKRMWGGGKLHPDLQLRNDGGDNLEDGNEDAAWKPDSWEDETFIAGMKSGDLTIPQKSIAMARDEIRNFDRLDEDGKKNILAAAPMTESDLVNEAHIHSTVYIEVVFFSFLFSPFTRIYLSSVIRKGR